MTGNAQDRVMVGSYEGLETCGTREAQTLGVDLEWHIRSGGSLGWDLLRLLPGASIVLSQADSPELRVNRLEAMGTADSPIRIQSGLERLYIRGAATLRHVEYSGGYVVAKDVLELEDAALLGVLGFTVEGPGSRLTGFTARGSRLFIASAGAHVTEATLLDAPLHGIEIAAPDVRLEGCAVRGASSDGIRVLSGAGVVVRSCNIEANGGFAVRNQGAHPVDARQNWWGDPEGPLGPAGGGVSGDVDHSDPLAEPVALEPRP
jgi:hypothetical protein